MPLPTENLTKDSSMDEIREAISRAISQLVDEGREQDQAIAIAYSTAREAAGRVPPRRGSKLRMSARG